MPILSTRKICCHQRRLFKTNQPSAPQPHDIHVVVANYSGLFLPIAFTLIQAISFIKGGAMLSLDSTAIQTGEQYKDGAIINWNVYFNFINMFGRKPLKPCSQA